MKSIRFLIMVVVVGLTLVVIPVASAQESISGMPDDTAGVFLYSAGASAGTPDAPTGQPAGEPTDDVIAQALAFDLLEFIGDQPQEVDFFAPGAPEGAFSDVDLTLGAAIQGLTAIDSFGFIAAGRENAANYDAGTGGSISVGLREVPGVQGERVITSDGVSATGILGPDGAATPQEADAALDGCEIFIFDDAELSGMEIVLSSPTNSILIKIDDRQLNPNTADGADDTLICIDLDSLAEFDGTFIDTISIADDGMTMTAPPRLWGDTSLEIDAIAIRRSVTGATLFGTVFEDGDRDGEFSFFERGIAEVGVAVYLDTDQDGNLGPGEPALAHTTTDSQGNYLFTHLPPGQVIVVETDPAGYVSTTPNVVALTLVSSEAGGGISVDFGDIPEIFAFKHHQPPPSAPGKVEGQ